MSRASGLLMAWLLAVFTAVPGMAATAREPTQLLALSYHDVVADPAATLLDPTAITVDTLIAHFTWLAANDYQPVSLKQWRAAGQGSDLPPRAVLLSFDDGYSSFYKHVLPLLELFRFPAVLAPVSAWVDTPAGQPVQYGNELRTRDDFLSWTDIRQIAQSGWVEIATHSHDLHRGILANPQGNLLPAAAVHAFLSDAARYETDAEYSARIGADLRTSVARTRHHLGIEPAAMVWPYGAYNALADAAAHAVGVDLALTLDDRPNAVGSDHIHRVLVAADMDVAALAATAEAAFGLRPAKRPPLRAAHVDLDYVYDADPVQMGRNLDQLLDRMKYMHINTVFLQAFADPDGDGVADALYFPNRHLPVRSDLFNRVAWQLKTRAGVDVYAWMPVLAFRLPDPALNETLAVRADDGSHRERYHRLSPYSEQARRIIREIYDDLGRSSRFKGVLYHDDAFLTDREYPALGAIRKTADIIAWTDELTDILRAWQPDLSSARNLYAEVLLTPGAESWWAQSYPAFLERYDYTAVMAMPYLEEAEKPLPWLADLVDAAQRAAPDALARTVFHLQTVDWRTGDPVANRALAQQFDMLLRRGALNVAYYPDDFLGNHPDLAMLRSHLSTNRFPALKR